MPTQDENVSPWPCCENLAAKPCSPPPLCERRPPRIPTSGFAPLEASVFPVTEPSIVSRSPIVFILFVGLRTKLVQKLSISCRTSSRLWDLGPIASAPGIFPFEGVATAPSALNHNRSISRSSKRRMARTRTAGANAPKPNASAASTSNRSKNANTNSTSPGSRTNHSKTATNFPSRKTWPAKRSLNWKPSSMISARLSILSRRRNSLRNEVLCS